MKMKKIWKTGLLCIAVLFLLTGCVYGNLDVRMHADGTGELSASLSVRKDVYEELAQKGGNPFQGMRTETVTRENKQYVTCSIGYNNLTYEEMETKLGELAMDQEHKLFQSVSIQKNGGLFYSSYLFKAVTEAYPASELPAGSVKLDMKVTMPTKAEKIQGGRIEGGAAVFTLDDLASERTLVAQSSANNVAFVVVSIAVLAAAAAVVLWIVKRKQG